MGPRLRVCARSDGWGVRHSVPSTSCHSGTGRNLYPILYTEPAIGSRQKPALDSGSLPDLCPAQVPGVTAGPKTKRPATWQTFKIPVIKILMCDDLLHHRFIWGSYPNDHHLVAYIKRKMSECFSSLYRHVFDQLLTNNIKC